jgi:hypothetical protein
MPGRRVAAILDAGLADRPLEVGDLVRVQESPRLWRVVEIDHVRGWAVIGPADNAGATTIPISIAALQRAEG